MANGKHLEILEKGVEAWNRWRQRNPEVVRDLRISQDCSGSWCASATPAFESRYIAGRQIYLGDQAAYSPPEHNLAVSRERLIEIAMMQGCTIKSAWLEPEVDGYRFATVWLEGIESPLFFRQPWTTISKECLLD